MAQFAYLFGNRAKGHDKSQPRVLTHWDPVQRCGWTDCPAKAVSEYKGKVYCARHLLKTLQQQWQE